MNVELIDVFIGAPRDEPGVVYWVPAGSVGALVTDQVDDAGVPPPAGAPWPDASPTSDAATAGVVVAVKVDGYPVKVGPNPSPNPYRLGGASKSVTVLIQEHHVRKVGGGAVVIGGGGGGAGRHA